jgi:hypothetical protein
MRIPLLTAALMAASTLSPAQSIDRKQWTDMMSTALPTAFCTPQSYFRQCFKISAQECEEVASSATRICLSKHANDIPRVLTVPQDGQRWGTIIGQCAGNSVDATMLKQRISNAKCNDPNQWK